MTKEDTDKKAKEDKSERSAADKPERRRREEEKSIELYEKELVIRFENRHEILPKLIELVGHVSDSHSELFTQPGVTADVLGGTRARIIVSGCAKSTAWLATLGDLGLNPLIFRNCVRSGVDQAGYLLLSLSPSPAARLIDIVKAIQGAPKKP